MHKQFVINGRSCLTAMWQYPYAKTKCEKCRLTVSQLQKCNEYDAQTICDKWLCLFSSNVVVPVCKVQMKKKYMQQQIFNDKQRYQRGNQN